jgi:hypothetical protein
MRKREWEIIDPFSGETITTEEYECSIGIIGAEDTEAAVRYLEDSLNKMAPIQFKAKENESYRFTFMVSVQRRIIGNAKAPV